MTKVPPMDTHFARWYAECFMEEGAKRDLRWQGIVDVSSRGTFATVEVLARLAFQTPVPASGRKSENIQEEYTDIVTKISGGDSTFDPGNSVRELQILAASALIQMFSRLPDAAIVVTTSSMGGLRKPILPMDLVGLAENSLVTLSARKHTRTSIDTLDVATSAIDYTFDSVAQPTVGTEQIKSEFSRLHAATSATIKHIVEGQNQVVEALRRRIELDEEELQMLWWLLGGYSTSTDTPFAKIDGKFRSLVLAQELGEMTAVSPGPTSIRAMLSRAGINTSKLKLSDVVNAPSLKWAQSVSKSKMISPVTTPIHFALEQRAELGTSDMWQASWSGFTGIHADSQLPAVKIGELFYREYVFLYVNA